MFSNVPSTWLKALSHENPISARKGVMVSFKAVMKSPFGSLRAWSTFTSNLVMTKLYEL